MPLLISPNGISELGEPPHCGGFFIFIQNHTMKGIIYIFLIPALTSCYSYTMTVGNGKVVLEVGTDNTDDYYRIACFIGRLKILL